MILFFLLASLLAAPDHQEVPPRRTVPPQSSSAARDAALDAIKNAAPVTGERRVPSGSAPNLPAASRGAAGSASAARPTVARATDSDRKASILFAANAQLQQELANRRQIISVANINTPEAAIAELDAGNNRFVNGGRVRTLFAAQDPELRTSLESKHSPFAIIVSCSDSRVVDNLIFDQEMGRLLSIRAAGNSPDTGGIASIEYAVEHLGPKIVVIMGHTKCGAVKAVKEAGGQRLPGNMYIFQELMSGLLEAVPKDPNEDEAGHLSRLEEENAKYQAQMVYHHSSIVRSHVDQNRIWLLPATYDIHTGQVSFFSPIRGQ